jgi:hypothetical protein
VKLTVATWDEKTGGIVTSPGMAEKGKAGGPADQRPQARGIRLNRLFRRRAARQDAEERGLADRDIVRVGCTGFDLRGVTEGAQVKKPRGAACHSQIGIRILQEDRSAPALPVGEVGEQPLPHGRGFRQATVAEQEIDRWTVAQKIREVPRDRRVASIWQPHFPQAGGGAQGTLVGARFRKKPLDQQALHLAGADLQPQGAREQGGAGSGDGDRPAALGFTRGR